MAIQEERQRLQNVDPYRFKDFIAELWERQDWETEVTGSSSEMGVDIVAEKTDGMVDQKLVIQAKRYSEGNKVGRSDIEVQNPTADATVIVTTSTFSKPVEEWAAERNVKLIDGEDLIDLVREKDAYDLLDEYAPTLREEKLNPSSPSSGIESRTGPSTEEVKLPQWISDEERQKYVGIGGILAGVVIIANPWGSQLPVGIIGTIVAVAAIGAWQFPEEIWKAVTPDRTVHRKFDHGGAVVEQGDEIRYEPDDNKRNPVVFDSSDDRTNRQRAVLYGVLEERSGGELPDVDEHVLPTSIATQGEGTIAAYRFAVHKEQPAQIASEMDLTQQEIVDKLANLVNN